MKYFFLAGAFLSACSISFGLPTQQFPSPSEISDAAKLWAQDTAKVSQFLDTAATLSGAEFLSAASSALSAEKDELIHKQVLDTALGQASIIQNANKTLVLEGTFQMVVDLLQDMASNGVSRIANVDKINNVRCPRVLPAIDAYFAAAARQVKKGPQVLATFPKVCRKG